MGFFKTIIDGIVKVGATVVGVTSHFVMEFKEKVKETVYRLQTDNVDFSNEISETKSVNDQIIDVEAKRNRDGSLNSNDRFKLEELYKIRRQLRTDIENKKEMVLAQDIAQNDHLFDSINVDDNNLHILQFHVGQNVLGKKCNRCNKPLILQWQRGKKVRSISEFFWGCSGYYDQTCLATQIISQTEYNLIIKTDRPEFEISNTALNRIVELPTSRNNIRKRMNNIKNTETQEYLCPIHGEPMIVRENKTLNVGLMEQYFLSCPRYFNSGCKQIVTIKSAGQLAAVLEKYYGKGIL